MTGALSDRDLGWLRYLHRKATTPDSWDRDGQPHEHWDTESTRRCCAGTGSTSSTRPTRWR